MSKRILVKQAFGGVGIGGIRDYFPGEYIVPDRLLEHQLVKTLIDCGKIQVFDDIKNKPAGGKKEKETPTLEGFIKPLQGLTKDKLQAEALKLELSFSPNATKDELINLIASTQFDEALKGK